MRQHRSHALVAVDLEKPCRAICHRQRTAIERRRWRKEVEARKLIDSRMRAVLSLVGCGDNAFGGRDPIQLTPRIAGLDSIDSAPPCVKRDMNRRRRLGRITQPENVRRGAMTELPEAWLDLAEHRENDALMRMREATTREDATEKSAVTPGPLAPARELLGDMLIDLNRPAEATAEYRATLKKDPNRRHDLRRVGGL